MSTQARPEPATPLDRAIKAADGVGALAELIGVNQTTVSMWRSRGGRVPAEHCAAIHTATDAIAAANGDPALIVTRRDLRPDDWWRIWPELIDAEHQAPDSAHGDLDEATPA
jgi:DNA-binding transcriptional regulator YdaS (Cro superfamily)